MLNINNKISENINDFMLFESGISCYVMSRFCLEATFATYYVPGFLLMQQALENLIKACLKKEGISWNKKNGGFGKKGHSFKRLIELGGEIEFLKEFKEREDLMSLLKNLEDGYNSQRYGESGHFISGHEVMMDLFDEMVFKLMYGFTGNKPRLPVPRYMQKTFMRKLKQTFVIQDVIPLLPDL